MSKKRYQLQILVAKRELRSGLVIKAYDTLTAILADMEKEDD